VTKEGIKSLTFATLDCLQGIPGPALPTEEEFPLPAWYRSVRGTPLGELGVEDLSKAIRQNIHLEQVVPLALQRLESEPLAGEMYDGELLASLKSVPPEYWPRHEAERLYVKSVVGSVLRQSSVTRDVRGDAEELLRKVG